MKLDNNYLHSLINLANLSYLDKDFQKIINLLKDQLRRLEIGKQGRKTIIQKNDYDNEMSKMMNLYEGLV